MCLLKFRGVSLFCLLGSLWLSTAWANQVVLKNGDRIAGSIVKKVDKRLTIKTDNFGVIIVSWDQVDSIIAENPLHIVLKDGKSLQGTLTAKNGKAEVTADQTKLTITPEDIASIRNDDEQKAYLRLLHPGLGQLWSGTGTIGFAGTAGNSKTMTFTIGLNANRATKTDKTSIYFNAIKASSLANGRNSDTAQAVRGGIGYEHNANSRLFLSVFNDNEYDRFQNLDLRFVIAGGMGFHAVKTDKSRLDFVGGGAYNRSSFSTPLVQNSGELYWGNDYGLNLNKATTLTQSYRMFNNLTETGAYRINFDLGLSTKIAKWLSWNVSISDRYLSNAAPGRKTNDFLYTTGIGIAFAK
jgi:hypothetical protein